MALILCLHFLQETGTPPLGTRKEVRMEVRVIRSPAVMGYLSIPRLLFSGQAR